MLIVNIIKEFQSCTRAGKLIAALTALIMASVALLIIFLLITDSYTAVYIAKNHLKHYLIGFVVAAILMILLRKYLTLEQQLIYVFLPSMIASGFPDLVYFVSYLVQKGTYVGVLTYKNSVYRLMHRPFASLLAGPALTALVYWFDTKKPMKYWYWPIILLILTAGLSLMHVLSDWYFGF